MKRIAALWCAVLLIGFAAEVWAQAPGGEAGTLKVTVRGFNSDKGDAKCAIFNSKETFMAGDKGLRMAALPIKGGKAEWVLSDLPFGTYAIKVYHDENLNGKLDKNMMGMPKEQYGFSNDARGSFGPPDFDKTTFTFNPSNAAITMSVE